MIRKRNQKVRNQKVRNERNEILGWDGEEIAGERPFPEGVEKRSGQKEGIAKSGDTD